MKRVFGGVSDSVNQPPTTTGGPAEGDGQENNGSFHDFAASFGSASRQTLQKPSRHSMHLDVSGSSKLISSQVVGRDPFHFNSHHHHHHLHHNHHSPLKRCDATMSSDPASMGSPVAKRRSLHCTSSLGSDLKMSLGSPPASRKNMEAPDDGSPFHWSGCQGPPLAITPTSVPKRASSLRKTTLQQRHGDSRVSWGRRAGERQLAQLGHDLGSPATKSRPRLSLDQYLPPDDRASPFVPGPLPNASAHAFQRPLPVQAPPQHPHPLSRSLTQSSSNSSLTTTDSPAHAPSPTARMGEKPRIPAIFAKSLPIGSRPPPRRDMSMATPAYKNAKPFEGAFMSTGLVSKVNRNPEHGPLHGLRGKATVMPDTPCKKQSTSSYPFATYPPGSEGRRQPSQRPTIDSPGGLFGASTKRQYKTLDKQDRSGGGILFRATHARKTSLISYDGDDNNVSVGGDDFPPTPTKNLFPRALGTAKGLTATPTVSHIFAAPTSTLRGKQQGTQQRDSSPLGREAPNHHSSPPTPLEAIKPPDGSRLSLRNVNDKLRSSMPAGSRPIPPPATPTTHGRDSLFAFGDRRVTPQNVHAPKDVDESLMTRFGRAEMIGRGEFSDVYRVAAHDSLSTLALGASTPSKVPSHAAASASEQLYAVKRIKLAGCGEKARQLKYREVQALQALGGAERILTYINSWEHGDYLYIQTEYCSEGSLDLYLEKLGNIGRMDDFRIWKIVSDLAEGLQTIHEAGFIHLDLKPANVLIDYAGQLKIGDFGMATTWPAPKGIEGEGDREYMAPEILEGRFDKPADIFSLGMIIYEAASNSILPDYGVVWQALRSGNAGSMAVLTNTTYLNMTRDATGMPLVHTLGSGPSSLDEHVLAGAGFGSQHNFALDLGTPEAATHDARNLFRSSDEKLRNHLEHPPAFMEDVNDGGSIDTLVHWMLKPNPAERPTAQQIHEFESVRWVNDRRKGGAIVYEGNFGPKVDDLVDTEMTDVSKAPPHSPLLVDSVNICPSFTLLHTLLDTAQAGRQGAITQE